VDEIKEICSEKDNKENFGEKPIDMK